MLNKIIKASIWIVIIVVMLSMTYCSLSITNDYNQKVKENEVHLQETCIKNEKLIEDMWEKRDTFNYKMTRLITKAINWQDEYCD